MRRPVRVSSAKTANSRAALRYSVAGAKVASSSWATCTGSVGPIVLATATGAASSARAAATSRRWRTASPGGRAALFLNVGGRDVLLRLLPGAVGAHVVGLLAQRSHD